MTTTDCGKMSGTSELISRLSDWGTSDTERGKALYRDLQDAIQVISKLQHDLANAECAARLMGEVYDRMVLKYEAQLTALRESVEKLTAG